MGKSVFKITKLFIPSLSLYNLKSFTKMRLKTGNRIFTQSAYKFFNALFIIVKYSMIH